VQYTRRDWRNRNMIKTAKGSKWLTIPVESKGNYLAAIEDMLIADDTWASKHWNTIQINYARAPYFDLYKNELKELYESLESMSLSKVNRTFLEYICSILKIDTRITNASDYVLMEDRNMKLVHICEQLGATKYYSGPRAQGYLDEALFREHGIEVLWMDYSNYPEYEQLYPPFEHAVTVLDLLFMEGPNATNYMKSFGSVVA
jgi:hypothetical protein